ncbi:MAG: phage integrase N-terminal SAM-like domain-containing protein, partial [Bifidobacterium sp.]|nr:phage integrase N-terminal SAM-like domain-containing protein [Bifidobacterium sp.]
MAQMNLDQVIAQYLAPLSPTTRASYKSTINSWLRWCDLNQLDPLKATASHIEVYGRYLRAQLGRSVHYQATSLSVISNLYKQAHHAGLVPEDPGPYVRRPKVPNHSTGTILERDQARDLLHAAIRDPDPRLDALTRLLLLNGCRLSEALNLDIPDHHQGEHPWILVCRKGGWEQRIGITQATSQAITRITGRRTHGPVFRRHDQRLPRGA